MNKNDFILRLREGLSGLPEDEKEEHISFYSEMIDDRVEEGFSEEDAVFAVGDLNEIIVGITADSPASATNKKKKSVKKLAWWVILLLALGSPIWLSIGISAIAVIFSLYAVMWSVIAALWSAEVSVIAVGIYSIAAGSGMIFGGSTLSGIALFGAAIFLAGISILLLLGCKSATKHTVLLTKSVALWIKGLFLKKGEIK